MKYIISGTDREASNSLKVAGIIQTQYASLGEKVEIIDLRLLSGSFAKGPQYGNVTDHQLKSFVEKVDSSDGLIVVVPEYNGSMPGILKYFIDHLKYPDAFEYRPVAFVGLGGMFGGLRPVEHLQQVFSYRNAFLFPDRIFLINVAKLLIEGKIQNELTEQLMLKQARGFQTFCKALAENNLHAIKIKR